MNRTMTGMLLVMSCLFAGGVLAQGVQEHPQPSTATTTSGAKALTGTAATVTAPRFFRARTKRYPKRGERGCRISSTGEKVYLRALTKYAGRGRLLGISYRQPAQKMRNRRLSPTFLPWSRMKTSSMSPLARGLSSSAILGPMGSSPCLRPRATHR